MARLVEERDDRHRAIIWSDKVKLQKTTQGWRAADIMRGVSPNSGDREPLIGMLRKYVDIACPEN